MNPLKVLLVSAPCLLLFSACSREQAARSTPLPAVTVVTLKGEPVTLTRELPGRTTPYLVAEIRPQISGIVQRRLFTEGGQVEAGQVLYQIDDASYQAANNSAKAALTRAETALDLARVNARRTAGLAKVDAVSQQDNENAIAALRQAEADVGVARATLTGSEVTLGYTKITSPIRGRAGISSVTQGALVTANQTEVLTTVQQLDPIFVDITLSSRVLLDLREELASGKLERTGELPVSVILENGSPYPHPGKAALADLTVDPTTGSFRVRVVVPNPEGVLQPGMYVRVVAIDGVRQDALLVPQQGITRDPKGNATALVVGPGDKVELRQVQVSRTIGDKWLVDSGLAAGDRVVVEGLQRIRPGSTVRVTEATVAASAENPAQK